MRKSNMLRVRIFHYLDLIFLFYWRIKNKSPPLYFSSHVFFFYIVIDCALRKKVDLNNERFYRIFASRKLSKIIRF